MTRCMRCSKPGKAACDGCWYHFIEATKNDEYIIQPFVKWKYNFELFIEQEMQKRGFNPRRTVRFE